MPDTDFSTIAFSLQALRHWMRRHNILGKALLVPKDNDTRALLVEAVRAEGFDDPEAILADFSDVLETTSPRERE